MLLRRKSVKTKQELEMKEIDPTIMRILMLIHFTFTMPAGGWLLVKVARSNEGTLYENIRHPTFVGIGLYLILTTLAAYTSHGSILDGSSSLTTRRNEYEIDEFCMK